MPQNAMTITVPPKLAADGLNFFVPLFQASCALGFGTYDSGSVCDQGADFSESSQRDSWQRWQDQKPIRHAIGKSDSAVLHGHAMNQSIFISDVVVIARQDFGRIGSLELDEIRHLIAVVVNDVRNRQALLHQE